MTLPSRNLRRIGALALTACSVLAYLGVRAWAANAEGEWNPALAMGKAPRLQSGTIGPISLSKPTGRAVFNVSFPESYTLPPRVVLTVVGSSELPATVRLNRAASTTGFQGVAQASYFKQDPSISVSVNWMALGE